MPISFLQYKRSFVKREYQLLDRVIDILHQERLGFRVLGQVEVPEADCLGELDEDTVLLRRSSILLEAAPLILDERVMVE